MPGREAAYALARVPMLMPEYGNVQYAAPAPLPPDCSAATSSGDRVGAEIADDDQVVSGQVVLPDDRPVLAAVADQDALQPITEGAPTDRCAVNGCPRLTRLRYANG